VDYNKNVFRSPRFEQAYQDIKYIYLFGKAPTAEKIAVVLGGLPGAGKGNIYRFYDTQTDNKIVHLDLDEFRAFHPQATSFSAEEYAMKTQEFADACVNRMIDEISKEGYSFIVESALKRPRTAFLYSSELKPMGYRMELAVMATDEKTAWQGTIDRYETAKIEYERALANNEKRLIPPRPVNREFFDIVRNNICSSLAMVYSGINEHGDFVPTVDDITLYDRNGSIFYHQSETPEIDPTPILDIRLNYPPETANDLLEQYKKNQINGVSKNILTKSSIATLEKMNNDSQLYTDFLKFQGRLFKHNITAALEFFVQNPNAEFVATLEQWNKAGFTVSPNQDSMLLLVNNQVVDYYDYTQTNEQRKPVVWTVHSGNVEEIKNKLSLNNQSLINGLINQTLKNSDVINCMQKLNIPESEYLKFRSAFVNAMQITMAGRLEMGGNQFHYNADLSALNLLPTSQHKLYFFSYVSSYARQALLKIETIMKENAMTERNEENDLRSMEQSDSIRKGNNSRERTTDNPTRATSERSNLIKDDSSQRSTDLADSTENQQHRNRTSSTGIQSQETQRRNSDIQVESTDSNVQHESQRSELTERGNGNRDIRSQMDDVHGERISTFSGGNDSSSEISSSSNISESESERISRYSGRTVSTIESTSNEFQRNSGIRENEDVLHRRNSDERYNISTDNSSSFNEKLNNVFTTQTTPIEENEENNVNIYSLFEEYIKTIDKEVYFESISPEQRKNYFQKYLSETLDEETTEWRDHITLPRHAEYISHIESYVAVGVEVLDSTFETAIRTEKEKLNAPFDAIKVNFWGEENAKIRAKHVLPSLYGTKVDIEDSITANDLRETWERVYDEYTIYDTQTEKDTIIPETVELHNEDENDLGNIEDNNSEINNSDSINLEVTEPHDETQIQSENEEYIEELPIIYAHNSLDKVRDNIEAIEELNRIERVLGWSSTPYSKNDKAYDSKLNSDKRLIKYSGWGGLSEIFEENNSPTYNAQHTKLKVLLTDEQYRSARSSVLNSHFTPQVIIDAMYKAVKNMDLPKNANILEPSCGTGNFITRLPSTFRDAQITAIELDEITAKIATYLNYDNPNVTVINDAFEKANIINNSYDLVIGNVPFGDYNMNDPDYTDNWRIHDAFFRKALDKVAVGGVVAFITSSGTMDKQNPKVREYIAEKAELIGAIRLPNNAFSSAGTKVTSDIIFLQKREVPLNANDNKPDWCYTAKDQNGLKINAYFVQNPNMILGKMEQTTFHNRLTCTPYENSNFELLLNNAIKNLNAKINIKKRENVNKKISSVEAWGDNFSYHIKDDKLYYRQNNIMIDCNKQTKNTDIIKALCNIRDITRNLYDLQATNISDDELNICRQKLNDAYDTFVGKYGAIGKVSKCFRDDIDYPIVCSLETFDENTKTYGKTDIFSTRTVNPTIEITKVNTIDEAMQHSIDRLGKPDIPYMSTLMKDNYPNITFEEVQENIYKDLINSDSIFIDPEQIVPDTNYSGVVEKSEYLSGNVRMKLNIAQEYALQNIEYQRNVDALTKVIPEDILADEISVRMGCVWISAEDYTDFLNELSGRPSNDKIYQVNHIATSGKFEVAKAGSKKNLNYNETTVYGTSKFNMYQLAEKLLNQTKICVYKEIPHPTDPSRTKSVTDARETKLALEKSKIIEQKFKEWIFSTPERKEKYERIYNNTFNSLVGRQYDGENLTFPGMNSSFKLRPHQKNCIARAISGNTLAAHVVGAGKSAVIIASVMKKKQLQLIHKACVVVPKPLVEQTANEWRNLYPNAKILSVKNDDLSQEVKREIFNSKVANGNFDAVIMSQEQFEKIPMSSQYYLQHLREEEDKIEDVYREAKKSGNPFTIKQLESALAKVRARIDSIANPKSASKGKDRLEFEKLGFDYLVCDEAHAYKNGFVVTKMNNVAGVTTRQSGRAEDMHMKTSYFNKEFGNGHILFATGTPVSNSMTELYVMTRYLRPDLLIQSGTDNFDDWAATFGNVVMKNQQTADGRLKMKAKFASFANLPELMAIYKEFADIQSAEKLDLPRPSLKNGKPEIVKVQATPEQKAYVKELARRAEEYEAGRVEPYVDNHLKITSEARLIGLGNQAIKALYNKRGDDFPDELLKEKSGKVDKCIENVASIYNQTKDTRGVQIIFSDIAVNSDNGNFSAYEYIKKELIETYSIPEDEIIFAPKSASKDREKIFSDINNSKYRIVIASTNTLGTGANIQKNLYALHHLDTPWKPSDFEQRNGRILRQGNTNKEVEIKYYVTEGTLDSYLYQTVTDKARFISQLLDNQAPSRVCEDCDEKVLTFSEIQAAAEGNPDFKRRIELSSEVAELTMLRNEFNHEIAKAKKDTELIPQRIEESNKKLTNIRMDLKQIESYNETFILTQPTGTQLTEKKEINQYISDMLNKKIENENNNINYEPTFKINNFDFSIKAEKRYTNLLTSSEESSFDCKFIMQGHEKYEFSAGANENQDNFIRIKHAFDNVVPKREEQMINLINHLEDNLNQAVERSSMTFNREQEYVEKVQELQRLESKLLGENSNDILDADFEVENNDNQETNNNNMDNRIR